MIGLRYLAGISALFLTAWFAGICWAGGGDGGGGEGRGCYTCGGGGKVDGRGHDGPSGGIGSGNVTGGPGYGTPR